MVVTIIIALVMTGVGLSIGATSRSNLRSSTWKLAAAIRYAYSRAVTQGYTVRLVMDFEKGTFHLEESDKRVVLTRVDETGEGLRREGEEDYGDAGPDDGRSMLDRQMDSIGGSTSSGDNSMSMGSTGMGGGMMGGGMMGMMAGGGDMSMMMDSVATGDVSDPFLAKMQASMTGNTRGYVRPRFKPLPEKRGQKRELDGETKFAAVFTPHDPVTREEGRGFIYFFPGGLTEHSIIHLSDGQDRIYSIEVHPLTGRPDIYNEAIEPEEELDELQEADE
jgi:hypothetical protein